MAYLGRVRRWDVFWADLQPPVGSEQRGERRPVVVVSSDGFNAAMTTVTVIPLTKLEGKLRKPYAFEVLLPSGTVGAHVTSIVMPHQTGTGRCLTRRYFNEPRSAKRISRAAYTTRVSLSPRASKDVGPSDCGA